MRRVSTPIGPAYGLYVVLKSLVVVEYFYTRYRINQGKAWAAGTVGSGGLTMV
jgi:hypothetical protein